MLVFTQSGNFSKIAVDHREEVKFRHRALKRFPKEHVEALWGYIRNDTAYICAFLKCDLERVSSRGLKTPDDELENHQEDARDAMVVDSVTGDRIRLELLGTIHTHPDSDDAVLSEFDVRDQLDTPEVICAVCAIVLKNKDQKGQRRITKIDYWPALRPLPVVRKREYESFTAKAGGKKRSRKRRR